MSASLEALEDLPIEAVAYGFVYAGSAVIHSIIKVGKFAVGALQNRRSNVRVNNAFLRVPRSFTNFSYSIADTYISTLPSNVQEMLTGYTSYQVRYPLSYVTLITSEDFNAHKRKKFEFQYDSLYEQEDSIQQIGVSSFYDKFNHLQYGIVIKTGSEDSLSKLHYFMQMKGIFEFKRSNRKKDYSISFVCKVGETHDLIHCLNILRRHNGFLFGYNPIPALIHKITPYPFTKTIYNDPEGSLTFVKRDLDNGFISKIEFSQHLDKQVIWQIVLTFNETPYAYEAYNEYLQKLQIFSLRIVNDSSPQQAFYQLRGTTEREVTEFQDFMYQLGQNNFNKFHQNKFEHIVDTIKITPD